MLEEKQETLIEFIETKLNIKLYEHQKSVIFGAEYGKALDNLNDGLVIRTGYRQWGQTTVFICRALFHAREEKEDVLYFSFSQRESDMCHKMARDILKDSEFTEYYITNDKIKFSIGSVTFVPLSRNIDYNRTSHDWRIYDMIHEAMIMDSFKFKVVNETIEKVTVEIEKISKNK